MPRQPRLERPGIPRHVIQRGVNRCAIFLDDDNRHRYRRLLRDACRGQAVAIHAFVELNPVRAAMVATADACRWSSVHTHLGTPATPCCTCTLPTCRQARTAAHAHAHGAVGWTKGLPKTTLPPCGGTCSRNAHWATSGSSAWSPGP